MEAREFASRRKPAACFVSATKTTIPGNSDTNCKVDDNFKTFWNLLSSADWLLFRNRSCDFLYFLLWYNFVYNTVKPAGRFGGPSSQLTSQVFVRWQWCCIEAGWLRFDASLLRCKSVYYCYVAYCITFVMQYPWTFLYSVLNYPLLPILMTTFSGVFVP